MASVRISRQLVCPADKIGLQNQGKSTEHSILKKNVCMYEIYTLRDGLCKLRSSVDSLNAGL